MASEVSETSSPEETEAVAARLARRLAAGDVVLLEGELGAGKTCFVRGLAMGLGLDPDEVSSPTFTIVTVHVAPREGALGLAHVDLYRIVDASELDEVGLEELPGPAAVLAIEWPDRLRRVPPRAIRVTLRDLGSDRRSIEVTTGD